MAEYCQIHEKSYFAVLDSLYINNKKIDIVLGYNNNYNVNIDEQWVPWGKCFTIKSYNASHNERIFVQPIHDGERGLGIGHLHTII